MQKSSSQQESRKVDLDKILLILLDILQGHMLTCNGDSRRATPVRGRYVDKEIITDINNNLDIKKLRIVETNCPDIDVPVKRNVELVIKRSKTDNKSMPGVPSKSCYEKKSCSNIYDKVQRPKIRNVESGACKMTNRISRYAETDNCPCTAENRCYPNSDCGFQCWPSCSTQSFGLCAAKSVEFQSVKGTAKDTESSIRETSIATSSEQNDDNKESDGLREKTQGFAGTGGSSKKSRIQLKKCRDLTGKYSLDNIAGIGARKMLDQIPETLCLKRHQTCSLPSDFRKFDDRSTDRGKESSCSLECPKECNDVTFHDSDSFPLLITDNQGLMEIHILCLQLSTSASQILFKERNICNVSLFVSWDIWGQDTAYTPTIRCPKLNFNSSFVYRIPDLFGFFDYVLSEYVAFRVNVLQRNEANYVVARAKLCIKDILDYPQNKLHYVAPVNSVIPCSLGTNFGQLSLWIRLSCDIEKIEAFKKNRGLRSIQDESSETNGKRDGNSSAHDLFVLKDPEALHEPSKDLLFVPLDQRIAAKVPQSSDKTGTEVRAPFNVPSEILGKVGPNEGKSLQMENEEETSDENEKLDDTTKKDDTEERRDSEDETESLSVAEFNAVLADTKNDELTIRDSDSTIREMGEVFTEKNWKMYKDRSYQTFARLKESQRADETEPVNSLRDYYESQEKDAIIIEIVSITLFESSSVMEDKEIHLLYVEYSFLGHHGADMETVSVEKPKIPNQKLVYNFRKKFRIDEETHRIERNTLRAMLDESINPNVRFIVVSEPLPEETDIKECVEVGYAYFNIREYALGVGNKNVLLPITNRDLSEHIGSLKIIVLGLDAIRQCLGSSS